MDPTKAMAIYPHEIREMRRRFGLTQEALAALLRDQPEGLETTQETVARWETGKASPSGPARLILRRLMRGDPPPAPVGMLAEWEGVIEDCERMRLQAVERGDESLAAACVAIGRLARLTVAQIKAGKFG